MALRRIVLRDFVIVQRLELEFGEGFTALTGETGAGKSILLEALQLALGARAEASFVREGARSADICAEFDCPVYLHDWLEESGFNQEETLLLRRTIDVQGKSRAWINGSPSTATQLRTLGEQLLDIHGQHAWQRLMRTDDVRALLDAFAGSSALIVNTLWTQWRASLSKIEQATAEHSTLLRERERLQWQISELEKLAPADDEWEALNTQHTRLTHAQKLLETVQAVIAMLDGDDVGARAGLARAHDTLAAQDHLEPAFKDLAETLASSLAQTDETLRGLHAYLRHVDLDPEHLADLDTRVSLWISLARRYKRPPVELPVLLQSWKTELQQLDAASDMETLQEEESRQANAYHEAARTLTLLRAKAAPRLSHEVTAAMQGLGMSGGIFLVSIKKSAEAGPYGCDDITFMVSGNPGMEPRPIAKVASGGELSRISLAIAVATSALGSAGTLIFDEVDAGVGGAAASSVGRLMQQLGRTRQVLAVTHLPQVAAYANHHLVVSKTRGSTTTSQVAEVQGQARVSEIARMLGGEQITPQSLAHAREMLNAAQSSEPQKSTP